MMTKTPKDQLVRVITFSRLGRKLNRAEKEFLAKLMDWCEANAEGRWFYDMFDGDTYFETEALADAFHAAFARKLAAIHADNRVESPRNPPRFPAQ